MGKGVRARRDPRLACRWAGWGGGHVACPEGTPVTCSTQWGRGRECGEG